ncbi:PspA/IM30 family protein [Corynebacterium sp. sy017]|uniref:PspA/IM30 family protein n=1 Tax=unclassified Corynebacterium TaxID=2624378 RepID=UPI001186C021|nr:PspA/IM30 family protein [Corynebacterium sp. SY003]MBP3088212.1 PspA/IM30 family protein [Corynebacterium sp. sy017]TSD91546.1 PspA/IM30 family protein [Corynebacterium sp. SY003]
MANPFAKGWKYLTASLDQKIEENADPKVQINQAVTAAKQQHEQIVQQASAVIGNKNQLEMKLNQLVQEQQDLTEKTRQALAQSDAAQRTGDAEENTKFAHVAEIYATQLVSVEQQLEEAKTLHKQSVNAAEQAKQQVKASEIKLKEQLAQADELMRQVQQTQMQESSARSVEQLGAFQADSTVPSMDSVREKIERRYAQALGAQELMQDSVDGRIAEIDVSGQDMRAASRLAEIRAELDAGKTQAQGEIEQ